MLEEKKTLWPVAGVSRPQGAVGRRKFIPNCGFAEPLLSLD